ncbi:MAG: hypothetical protein IKE55_03470 [Kiritimatiellae bacterium]|nr:hypothetical protein [Kiritimatiellia bacterium]
MKSCNVIFAVMMTLLTICVSFLGETGFAQCIRDFIAYSPWVPIVRKMSLGSGCAIVAIAIAYGTISKLRSSKVVVVMSDEAALFPLIVVLIDVPLLCCELAVITYCDFWQLQQSVAFVLSFTGSLVAVRSKHYRYVLYYIILFLLFAGLIPPA